MEECYDKQFSMYVNEFVDLNGSKTLLKITNSTYIIDQFANDNNRIEHILKISRGFGSVSRSFRHQATLTLILMRYWPLKT